MVNVQIPALNSLINRWHGYKNDNQSSLDNIIDVVLPSLNLELESWTTSRNNYIAAQNALGDDSSGTIGDAYSDWQTWEGYLSANESRKNQLTNTLCPNAYDDWQTWVHLQSNWEGYASDNLTLANNIGDQSSIIADYEYQQDYWDQRVIDLGDDSHGEIGVAYSNWQSLVSDVNWHISERSRLLETIDGDSGDLCTLVYMSGSAHIVVYESGTLMYNEEQAYQNVLYNEINPRQDRVDVLDGPSSNSESIAYAENRMNYYLGLWESTYKYIYYSYYLNWKGIRDERKDERDTKVSEIGINGGNAASSNGLWHDYWVHVEQKAAYKSQAINNFDVRDQYYHTLYDNGGLIDQRNDAEAHYNSKVQEKQDAQANYDWYCAELTSLYADQDQYEQYMQNYNDACSYLDNIIYPNEASTHTTYNNLVYERDFTVTDKIGICNWKIDGTAYTTLVGGTVYSAWNGLHGEYNDLVTLRDVTYPANIAVCDSEISDLNSQIAQAENDRDVTYPNNIATCDSKITDLNTQLSALNTEASLRSDDITTATTHADNVWNDYTNLINLRDNVYSPGMTDSQSRIDQYTADQNTLQNNLDNAQQNVDNAQATITNYNTVISQLNSEIDVLESDMSDISQQLGETGDEILALEMQINELTETTIPNLEELINTYEIVTIPGIEADINSLELEIADLEQDITELDTQINNLNDEINDYNSEISDLNTQIDNLNNVVIPEINANITSIESDRDQLNSSLIQLNELYAEQQNNYLTNATARIDEAYEFTLHTLKPLLTDIYADEYNQPLGSVHQVPFSSYTVENANIWDYTYDLEAYPDGMIRAGAYIQDKAGNNDTAVSDLYYLNTHAPNIQLFTPSEGEQVVLEANRDNCIAITLYSPDRDLANISLQAVTSESIDDSNIIEINSFKILPGNKIEFNLWLSAENTARLLNGSISNPMLYFNITAVDWSGQTSSIHSSIQCVSQKMKIRLI